jgi:cardiolipin synthase
MHYGAAVLAFVAVIAFVWPRVLAWPAGLISLWLALALVLRARRP